jgi:hypothetical protein
MTRHWCFIGRLPFTTTEIRRFGIGGNRYKHNIPCSNSVDCHFPLSSNLNLTAKNNAKIKANTVNKIDLLFYYKLLAFVCVMTIVSEQANIGVIQVL